MDFQYALLGIGVSLVGFFIYIISAYAMKGQTYEEALFTQRKLNQTNSIVRKDEYKNKDKKEKEKEKEKVKKNSKKEKLKDTNELNEKVKREIKVDNKLLKQDLKTEVQSISVVKNVKNENIEKKKVNEVHLVESNKILKTNEKLKNHVNSKTNIQTNEKVNEDINSFTGNVVIEEKKQKSLPKHEKNQIKIEKTTNSKNEKFIFDNIKNELKNVVENNLNNSTSSQLNLEFDISVTKLVELIKTVPLSNEETQVLIDALLSKNSEGSSDWINKNDPITVLKKQLEEKETDLKVEIENHERAKARIAFMRDEINQEKQKQVHYKNQIYFFDQKFKQLEIKLQNIDESKLDEINKLKIDLNKIEMKLTENHNLSVMKLNDEKARTQQALNQLEKEKSKQNMFNFKLMQLSNERQQFEEINSNLEKLNEELKNENLKIKEHISQLKNEFEINEFNYKKQLNEKEENYKAIILKLEEKSKELNSNVINTAQLQVKLEGILNRNEKIYDELNSLKKSLQVAKKEKQSLVNIVNELNPDGKKIDDNKVLEVVKDTVQKYKDLINQQPSSKEELRKLSDNLENEKSKNNALQSKISHYERTLMKAEKDLIEIGATADKEVHDLNLRIENTEKAYQDIIAENEKLIKKFAIKNEVNKKS